MRRPLHLPVLLAVATLLVSCGDGSRSADGPGTVESPPPIELDGAPPYGPGIEVGASYDYVLYTHCGIEWAPIDGVWWRTDPLGVGEASPPEGWGNPHDAGTLTVDGGDTATYTSDTGIDVEFRRTDTVETPVACD